mmetsp:Transcript_10907/g.23296  ORF Transcript_10907/g.23296 Transcript_10907/m.23296 type:complete len:135 (-) Transcript_10907:1238-1642(-)
MKRTCKRRLCRRCFSSEVEAGHPPDRWRSRRTLGALVIASTRHLHGSSAETLFDSPPMSSDLCGRREGEIKERERERCTWRAKVRSAAFEICLLYVILQKDQNTAEYKSRANKKNRTQSKVPQLVCIKPPLQFG